MLENKPRKLFSDQFTTDFSIFKTRSSGLTSLRLPILFYGRRSSDVLSLWSCPLSQGCVISNSCVHTRSTITCVPSREITVNHTELKKNKLSKILEKDITNRHSRTVALHYTYCSVAWCIVCLVRNSGKAVLESQHICRVQVRMFIPEICTQHTF